MAAAALAPLEELEAELAASHPERAVQAALAFLEAKGPPLEALLAAARAAAARFVLGAGQAPHVLLAFASAAGLQGVLDSRGRRAAVLQAVSLAASMPKSPKAVPPPHIVRGDVSHLGRSALFAARRGDLAEAESLFLGILKEGAERRQAGDVLFRAAVEDLGDSGHKLIVAVEMWRFSEAVGFRDARLLLRPAVQYLVLGARDRAPYERMLAILGRERVDLDALASASRPLDDAARARLAAAAAAPSDEACVRGLLSLLRDGFAPAALADGIVVEAAARVVAAEGYDLETAHALLHAHAARFALSFSRTSERIYALFLAALRCRSPAPHPPSARVDVAGTEADAVRRIQADLAAGRAIEAAAGVRAYLSRGFSPGRLVEALAGFAATGFSPSDPGHNLAFADACAAEYAATKASEILAALAKFLAASSRDAAAAEGRVARGGP